MALKRLKQQVLHGEAVMSHTTLDGPADVAKAVANSFLCGVILADGLSSLDTVCVCFKQGKIYILTTGQLVCKL